MTEDNLKTLDALLGRNLFLVEERPKLGKGAFAFDIRDPEDGDVLFTCREDAVGRVTRWFRFSSYKRTTPFDLHVRTANDDTAMRVSRGIPVVASHVRVIDEEGIRIGGFRQKPFSIGGAFDVLDAEDEPVCRLRGRPTGTEFLFMTPDNIELARVSKKWGGLGKELLTSADDYMLQIDDAVPADTVLRRLILASAICIGMVVKIELP